MVVSFKLETDPDLLIEKAKVALERYQHDLVVGNLLATRKFEVVFISPGRSEEWVRLPETAAEQASGRTPSALATPNDQGLEIESMIIPPISRLHSEYIQNYERR